MHTYRFLYFPNRDYTSYAHPIQATVSKKLASVRHRVSVLTDERVKLTNQVMTGARVMKINAWELAMEGEIRRQYTKPRCTVYLVFARQLEPYISPFIQQLENVVSRVIAGR